MRIAIIGTGISGLTAAHLLHPEHEIIVYEAGDHVGGHTNTIRVDTDDATLARRHRLHRPQRPQLPALRGAARRARRRAPADQHELLGQRRRTRTSSTPRAASRGLLAQPSNLARPRFLRMVADYVRFNRAARALLADAGDERSLGAFLDDEALLALVRRAPARAPGRRRVVGRPRADVVVPGALPRRSSSHHHGMLSLTGRPQWSTIAGGSARYVEALTAPFADRIRVRTPIAAVDPPPHPRRRRAATARRAEEFDEVVIAAHADQALRAADRPQPSARPRSSAPSPTSPTRRSCTPTARCCRAGAQRGRRGTITCSPSRAAAARSPTT